MSGWVQEGRVHKLFGGALKSEIDELAVLLNTKNSQRKNCRHCAQEDWTQSSNEANGTYRAPLVIVRHDPLRIRRKPCQGSANQDQGDMADLGTSQDNM